MDKKVSDEIIHTESTKLNKNKPSRKEAMEAVKTLISWAGDDPSREGLKSTPTRVIKAFKEYFAGYTQDPNKFLQKTLCSNKTHFLMIWNFNT